METQKNNTRIVLAQLLRNTSIIGVDIDGVLSDTIGAALKEVQKRFGNVLEFSQWKTWNPHQIDQLHEIGITTIEDTMSLFYSILKKDGSQIVSSLPGSQDGIQKFASMGKRLIALSGRIESSRPYTTEWLSQNYQSGAFQEILLTDHDTPKQVEKYELARQHGIGLMIEDNAQYAINLAKNGIPTILLEAPWNMDIDTTTYSNIYRVKDWEEILKILN